MVGAFKFEKVVQLVPLVLTLPHSNVDEEGDFSMVTKTNLGHATSALAYQVHVYNELAKTESCHKYG